MSGEESSVNPFTLLADETRLGIIEAIGDASGDGEYATLSYSTIREALDGVDPGTLNYHLRQLRGRFVERTDDGYQLSLPGIRVHQALVSRSFDGERRSVEPVEVGEHCESCGEPLLVSYDRERFFVRCHECDIVYHRYPVTPNAFDPSNPRMLVDVAMWKSHTDVWSMLRGVCPYCSGTVERALSRDDRGGTNNDDWELYAHLTCQSCGWFVHPPVEMVPYHHHATATFFDERGLTEHFTELRIDSEWTETVRSEDPWRVEVAMAYDGDTIRHIVDGDLNVVEWTVDGERPHRSASEPRRRAVADGDPPNRRRTERALSILADETRLGVIEAIGDASGDGEYVTLSYSTIQQALDGVDSGKLNYHLRQLRGRFVERTDDGYRLTVPGIRVYQAVSSGRFEDDRPTVPPTAMEACCKECDGPLRTSYEDGRFVVRCAGCDVRWLRYPLQPNAFDTQDVEGMVDTALTRNFLDLRSMFGGICPYCSGRVVHSISGDDGGMGLDDGSVFAHLSCTQCAWFAHPRVDMVAYVHHATATFYERHGRPKPTTRMVVDGEWTTTVLSTDPWRFHVDIHLEDDTLRHVVDENLDVVEWAVLD